MYNYLKKGDTGRGYRDGTPTNVLKKYLQKGDTGGGCQDVTPTNVLYNYLKRGTRGEGAKKSHLQNYCKIKKKRRGVTGLPRRDTYTCIVKKKNGGGGNRGSRQGARHMGGSRGGGALRYQTYKTALSVYSKSIAGIVQL